MSKIDTMIDLIMMSINPTQPVHTILGIFTVCSLCTAVFGTFKEHSRNTLKEMIFITVLNGKVVFVLKVYDMIITNLDLLENSSNNEVTFPEYLRDIP